MIKEEPKEKRKMIKSVSLADLSDDEEQLFEKYDNYDSDAEFDGLSDSDKSPVSDDSSETDFSDDELNSETSNDTLESDNENENTSEDSVEHPENCDNAQEMDSDEHPENFVNTEEIDSDEHPEDCNCNKDIFEYEENFNDDTSCDEKPSIFENHTYKTIDTKDLASLKSNIGNLTCNY